MSLELAPNPTQDESPQIPKYRLNPDQSYTIENYDHGLPFSSFLPGIAGPSGVPLWCMYVNRGQAVVSFGVGGKDSAVMEFLPATWAYQLASTQGFRTFVKVNGEFYEPFQQHLLPAGALRPHRSMRVQMHSVEVRETSHAHDLDIHVRYFSPVGQKLGMLVRRLKVTNTGADARTLQLLDGMPLILPCEVNDWMMKKMRRLTEAYCSCRLLADHIALYSMRVKAHDTAEVLPVHGANFFASWQVAGGQMRPLVPIVDPDVVFGSGNSFALPHRFVVAGDVNPEHQVWENRLPCAFAPLQSVLQPGQTLTVYSIAGFCASDPLLLELSDSIKVPQDFEAMDEHAHATMEEITRPAFTASNVPELDAYARQNYLDNVLRGGVPQLSPAKNSPRVPLYLYMRRHGDLERDYNEFHLAPHPMSTGPGNFRDILQNRRFNTWNYPDVLESEIRMFVDLLQADGYNPLVVEGYEWVFEDGDAELTSVWPADDQLLRESFANLIRKPFSPGQLLGWANQHGIQLPSGAEWLQSVLQLCRTQVRAHGHEGGYWIDHWTYIVDMLEAYAAIYPDKVTAALTEGQTVGWFSDGTRVLPRSEKTMRRSSGPLQNNCISEGHPEASRLPEVSIFAKLCALVAVKSVTFDYAGRGLEMEAGRPGWNDAMNGLPGLFGSSTCEAAELARLARWLLQNVDSPAEVSFPADVADLIEGAVADLELPQYDWDRAASIREHFRAAIADGGSGHTRAVTADQLRRLLEGADRRATRAVDASFDTATGLFHTYYKQVPRAIDEHKNADGTPRLDPANGSPLLAINSFTPEPLPLFLEGQVHALRLKRDTNAARIIHHAVRNSALLDTGLQMYKLNEPLTDCSPDIGRARTFSRGWYENESIWLHMNHKYLVELLRCGLHEEFFADTATMMVPFMNPEVYGRSILENSSFIASSACPDPAARGRGFVARLSGTTAEFIQLWSILTAGEQPFRLVNGQLELRLQPTLPGNWFTREPQVVHWNGAEVTLPENSFACAFLGTTLLVYHNPTRRNTFGPQPAIPASYKLDTTPPLPGPSITSHHAKELRDRQVNVLTVQLV